MKIKTLSLFQGNPQNNHQITDFKNSFTQQIQQFICYSNPQLKGPESKKKKNKAKKQLQQPSYSSVLNKGTENLRQQNTRAQEKITKTIR